MALALKSWSAALTRTRFLPPREKSPTFTVALASMEMRSTVVSASAAALTRLTCSKIALVAGSFFWVCSWPLWSDSSPTD